MILISPNVMFGDNLIIHFFLSAIWLSLIIIIWYNHYYWHILCHLFQMLFLLILRLSLQLSVCLIQNRFINKTLTFFFLIFLFFYIRLYELNLLSAKFLYVCPMYTKFRAFVLWLYSSLNNICWWNGQLSRMIKTWTILGNLIQTY